MANEELIQRMLEAIDRLGSQSKTGEIEGHTLADELGIERSDPGAELWWALKHAHERGQLPSVSFGGGMSAENTTIRT